MEQLLADVDPGTFAADRAGWPVSGGAPLRSCFADHPGLREILPAYVSGLPVHVAALTASMADGDVTALRRLIHGLRGSGGGYGFPDITRVAADVDEALSVGVRPAAMKPVVEELIGILRRVEGYDRTRERA